MNHHLRAARNFARLMDSQFNFLGIRFGIDSIIGIVPGIGDTLSFWLSLYLLWIGHQMRIPASAMVRMAINIGIDALIGMIPLFGDVSDLFFKANIRNLNILERFAEENILEGRIVE